MVDVLRKIFILNVLYRCTLKERGESKMDYLEEYEQFRLSEGISENTVDMEIKYLRKFHTHMNQKYKKVTNIYEIRSADIRELLDAESKHQKDQTIYRKISILSSYYDYLWRKEYIPVDFMTKFRSQYRKLNWKSENDVIDYGRMLEEKEAILSNEKFSLTARIIYVLLLGALELQDMINLRVDEVFIQGNTATIEFETVKGTIRTVEYTHPLEIATLKAGIQQAEKRKVSHLLSSKSKGVYGVYRAVNLFDMLAPLEKHIGFKLSSTKRVQYAFVFYLSQIKKETIEEISQKLGYTLAHTAQILKTVLERKEANSYNENKHQIS